MKYLWWKSRWEKKNHKYCFQSTFLTTFPVTAVTDPSTRGKISSSTSSRTWLVFLKIEESFFPISSLAMQSNSFWACSFTETIWEKIYCIKDNTQFEHYCSTQSVLCVNIHSTSLLLRLTVRTALFGLRVAGGSNRLKSPENSWLNSLSSISDAVDRWGRQSADTLKWGCFEVSVPSMMNAVRHGFISCQITYQNVPLEELG